jgi:multisubunit Na+/H+ antiporter MnhG subunit
MKNFYIYAFLCISLVLSVPLLATSNVYTFLQPATVPEPATISLLILGSFVFFLNRKRK